jgi:hypothetical protein
MHLVVAGRRMNKLLAALISMTASGMRTTQRLPWSRTPARPEGELNRPLPPGYVKARITGAAVCKEK